MELRSLRWGLLIVTLLQEGHVLGGARVFGDRKARFKFLDHKCEILIVSRLCDRETVDASLVLH